MRRLIIALFLLPQIVFAGTNIDSGAAAESVYIDGVYEGEYSFVKVGVTIKEGSIAEVKILEHGGGGGKYAEMIAPLAGEVVELQSINIDAITGATVSSRNFINAVDNALQKAAFKQAQE